MYPLMPFLLLPYARAELPAWGRLLKMTQVICAIDDTRWKEAPAAIIRGKNHGYVMRLELSDWAQRLTYFLGRYYELGVQRVLDLVLAPGDRFVDIGANIGMIMLHARSLVGSTGRIDCFEPNPECVAVLREHLKLNDIDNVTIHGFALSDQPGEMFLSLTSDHSGTGTLARVERAKQSILVSVRVGDDILMDGRPINALKIDVEGFELRVLCGLRHTLEMFKPIVITELIESQSNKVGTSIVEVSSLLKCLGYVPFGIGEVRKGLRHELALFRTTDNSSDAVWVHPTNKRSTALVRYVR